MEVNNKWYAQYCNLCAANVLNKDGQVRFSYEELHVALNAAAEDDYSLVPQPIMELQRNIINACNKQYGEVQITNALMLTLLNIHGAYLMMTGHWKDEPKDNDEGGVEIF